MGFLKIVCVLLLGIGLRLGMERPSGIKSSFCISTKQNSIDVLFYRSTQYADRGDFSADLDSQSPIELGLHHLFCNWEFCSDAKRRFRSDKSLWNRIHNDHSCMSKELNLSHLQRQWERSCVLDFKGNVQIRFLIWGSDFALPVHKLHPLYISEFLQTHTFLSSFRRPRACYELCVCKSFGISKRC